MSEFFPANALFIVLVIIVFDGATLHSSNNMPGSFYTSVGRVRTDGELLAFCGFEI